MGPVLSALSVSLSTGRPFWIRPCVLRPLQKPTMIVQHPCRLMVKACHQGVTMGQITSDVAFTGTAPKSRFSGIVMTQINIEVICKCWEMQILNCH